MIYPPADESLVSPLSFFQCLNSNMLPRSFSKGLYQNEEEKSELRDFVTKPPCPFGSTLTRSTREQRHRREYQWKRSLTLMLQVVNAPSTSGGPAHDAKFGNESFGVCSSQIPSPELTACRNLTLERKLNISSRILPQLLPSPPCVDRDLGS